MIRLIQRRLIIPRGDTGSFSIPVLKQPNAGDIAVFTIFDCSTRTRMFQKQVAAEGDTISIAFTHTDTVNLKPGKYFWDIKFYTNPVFVEDELVDGTEVDSYYAGYSLPDCEIRETADNYLIAPDGPDSYLTPEQLDIVTEAIAALQDAITKTETNVTHYPQIRDGVWYVWDAEVGDFISTDSHTPTKVSELENDSGYLTEESDPTVPAWAKQDTKPSYTASEVGALPADTYIPQKTSDLTNDSDFAVDANYVHTDNNYTTEEKTKLNSIAEGAEVNVNADWDATEGDAAILHKPTNVSAFENDAGYLTEHQDLSDYVQKTDYATDINAGLIRVNANYGLTNVSKQDVITGESVTYTAVMEATANNIKEGTDRYRIISSRRAPNAAFYGLAKAAGDTTQSKSSNAVGTYTNEAKAAIQTMLDVPSNADVAAKQDALTFDNTPTANSTNPVTSGGVYDAIANVNTMKIHICGQDEYDSETGMPTVANPDSQSFYLVPGGADSNLFIEWVYVNGAWERFGSADIEVPVTDVQVAGSSVVENGIAKIVKASASSYGVVKVDSTYGIGKMGNGSLTVITASQDEIKTGSSMYSSLAPISQHASTFYGLAKAAGDSTQSASSNAVGTYTAEAKTAIQTMLDVPAKSDIPDTSIYATKADTVLTTTLSRGRIANSIVGTWSFAWGNNVSAGGALSHAEGYNTSATGAISFVFGQNNVEDSYNSWPEWTANTFYVVGNKVKITNGNTIKAYVCKENNSDAEFIASKWTARPTGVINYAEIVGNGELNARSNAYALDWDGNGHYMGDVYVHANADSSGGTKLATIEDIPDAPVQDVRINGNSIVTNNIANIPKATPGTYGVVCPTNTYGVNIVGNNYIGLVAATDTQIKNGTAVYATILPNNQYKAVFYGLSKAAGVDLANETVTLGTYPETSKTAIKAMLGVQDGLKVVRLI